MHIAPGTILAEKYRVDRLIGEGGMGVVVAATHLKLHKQVAIKLLRPEAMANPSLIERFEREARAAARVTGEHVAQVSDVGKLAGGLPYIVMEYLEGEDLERALTRRGPLPIEETIDYLLQTCEAVGEAHAANIVHRDLKPANLFLSQRPNQDAPVLKVLDFGISKILEPETDAITRTSALMGTAYYMSPEQLTSAKKVDTRTDIWALGVILYELLTGKRPFEAGTMPEVVAQILENTPTPLKSLRPEVPDELCDVVSMCLRKVNERLPTVAALANALAPFAPEHALPLVARVNKLVTSSGQVPAPSVPAPAYHRIAVDPKADSQSATAVMGVTQADPEPQSLPTVETPRPARRSFSTVIGLGVVALLGIGAFSVVTVTRRPRPDEGHPLVQNGSASPLPSGAVPSATESAAPLMSAASSASAPVVAVLSAAPSARPRPTSAVASGSIANAGGTNAGAASARTMPSSSAGRNPLDMGGIK